MQDTVVVDLLNASALRSGWFCPETLSFKNRTGIPPMSQRSITKAITLSADQSVRQSRGFCPHGDVTGSTRSFYAALVASVGTTSEVARPFSSASFARRCALKHPSSRERHLPRHRKVTGLCYSDPTPKNRQLSPRRALCKPPAYGVPQRGRKRASFKLAEEVGNIAIGIPGASFQHLNRHRPGHPPTGSIQRGPSVGHRIGCAPVFEAKR